MPPGHQVPVRLLQAPLLLHEGGEAVGCLHLDRHLQQDMGAVDYQRLVLV